MRRIHHLFLLYALGFSYGLVQEAIRRNDGWQLWVAVVVAVAVPVPLAIYEVLRDARREDKTDG